VARWNDGGAAATETGLGRGCVRHVAITVDAIGDVALRASFRELANVLVEPCGGARDFAQAKLPAHTRAASAPQVPMGREPLWFAILALAVLLAEQALRTRRRPAVAA
jgi:hypothetical protein